MITKKTNKYIEAMKHVLDTREMTKDEIESILDRANEVSPGKSLSNKILALLFFEPSTRTRTSFEVAMKRLGGKSVRLGESSSIEKGETLADTVRVVQGYADAIVLRHPKEGSSRLASEFVSVPVINAGDGAGHHPTQTLLDLYTMREEKNSLEGLSVGIMGDLKYGRTVHSLSLALSKFDCTLSFISPPELKLPERMKAELSKEIKYKEFENIEDPIENLDVLYVTRIQKERFPNQEEYRKVAGSYRVSEEILQEKNITLMHPLPRIDEIDPSIDDKEQAKYFKQAHNGVPVRMAVLEEVMG